MLRSRMESLDIMDSLMQCSRPASALIPSETKIPSRQPARCRRCNPLQTFLADVVDQIAYATGVAPLVVVPRNYLDQGSADHEGHGRIDDRGARVSPEVRRDQFVLFVSEVALQWTILRRFLEGG